MTKYVAGKNCPISPLCTRLFSIKLCDNGCHFLVQISPAKIKYLNINLCYLSLSVVEKWVIYS